VIALVDKFAIIYGLLHPAAIFPYSDSLGPRDYPAFEANTAGADGGRVSFGWG